MTPINSYRIADNCRAQMVKRGIAAVTILEDEDGLLSFVTTGVSAWKLTAMMRTALKMANGIETVDIEFDGEPYGPAEPNDD